MTISQYIYTNLQKLYNISFSDVQKVEDEYCYLCGGLTDKKGLSTKKAIGHNFTNQEFRKNHNSKSVCEACAFLLKQSFIRYNEEKNKDSKVTFRIMSWIITPDFTYPKLQIEHNNIRISENINQEIIRNFIIEEKPESFILLFALSQKKHLFFRSTQVNNNSDFYKIMYEENELSINQHTLMELLEITETLLAFGFSKTAIQNVRLFHEDISTQVLLSNIISKLYRYKESLLLDFLLKISINKGEETKWNLYKQIQKKLLKSTDLTQKIKTKQQQHKSSTQSIEVETQKDSMQKSQKAIGEELKNSQEKQQEDQQLSFDF